MASSEVAQSAPSSENISDTTPEQKQMDFDQTLEKAKGHLSNDEYETAVDLLSDLLQNLTKEQQETIVGSIAHAYFLYGKALFRLSQTQNDVFGSAIREKQQEYAAELQDVQEEEDKQADVTNADDDTKMKDTEEETKQHTSEAPHSNGNAEPEVQADEEAGLPADEDSLSALMNAFGPVFEQAAALKQQLDEAQSNQPDIDTSEDRALAWESLETARSLLSDKGLMDDREQQLLLGDTHVLLAELLMEDEEFVRAFEDFKEGVRIYSEMKCQPRTIASVRVLWACAAQYNHSHDIATEQFRLSCELLLKQIALDSENTSILEGSPKDEDISLMEQKDAIVATARRYVAQKHDLKIRENIADLVSAFEETAERLNESMNADATKMEVDEVLNRENKGSSANGTTTIGFGPIEPSDTPVMDLGVVRKKKRTSSQADLDGPSAKKQRTE